MGVVNLPTDQLTAIEAIDTKALDQRLEQAVRTENPGDLRNFLGNCGTYISNKLHAFERALTEHREARAASKRARTADALWRARYDLSHAVSAMQLRVEQDRKDAELFYVEDRIFPPFRYGKRLNVDVSYRWRRTSTDDWKYGSITFEYEHDPRPDYSRPAAKRKLSPAKQEEELQRELSGAWEDLMRRALCSVRDYFKAGRDGAKIPKFFRAVPDSYYRTLNNQSTQFWHDEPR